jgi:hypothetical protein
VPSTKVSSLSPVVQNAGAATYAVGCMQAMFPTDLAVLPTATANM